MALPSSGQISMDDIRVELGVPSQSPFSMNTARQGGYVAINQFSPSIPPFSGQVSLSDWYNYCQNCGYNSGTFYYSDTDAATACAGTPNQTLYWSGTLGIGTILFTDPTGTTMASSGYWSDGTNSYYQVAPNGFIGITSITACTCEIVVNLFVSFGGGGYITATNQDTFVDYTITAADATGVGYVPAGSYIITDYGLTVPCTPPLMQYISPSSFSGECGSTVYIDIGCN